jgi:hypothetical protein
MVQQDQEVVFIRPLNPKRKLQYLTKTSSDFPTKWEVSYFNLNDKSNSINLSIWNQVIAPSATSASEEVAVGRSAVV